MPGWRNWQTRQTQNLVLARESEFDPRSGHHVSMLRFFNEWDVLIGGGRANGSVGEPAGLALAVHMPLSSGKDFEEKPLDTV